MNQGCRNALHPNKQISDWLSQSVIIIFIKTELTKSFIGFCLLVFILHTFRTEGVNCQDKFDSYQDHHMIIIRTVFIFINIVIIVSQQDHFHIDQEEPYHRFTKIILMALLTTRIIKSQATLGRVTLQKRKDLQQHCNQWKSELAIIRSVTLQCQCGPKHCHAQIRISGDQRPIYYHPFLLLFVLSVLKAEPYKLAGIAHELPNSNLKMKRG